MINLRRNEKVKTPDGFDDFVHIIPNKNRINSSIRPLYVNGVVYLNDEAGHSSIQPLIFNHSKTLKLCYTVLPFHIYDELSLN